MAAHLLRPRLWLKRCPKCDYSLLGLPAEGVCPECGRAYDQSAIYLIGWARGGHASLLNASPRAMVGVILLLLFQLWSVAQSFFLGGWDAIGGTTLILFLGLVAYEVYRRFTADAEGVLVVLWERGCLQVDDRRMTRETFWWICAGAIAFFVFIAAVVLIEYAQGTLPLLVVVVGAMLGGSMALAFGYGYSATRERLPENEPALRDIASFPHATPWTRVDEFTIIQSSATKYRLRILPRHRPWRLRMAVVDFEFTCTSVEAADIREQVEHWRAAAKPQQDAAAATAG